MKEKKTLRFVLTKAGIEKCETFISECYAKRKMLLESGVDTVEDTNIPTIEDIECDIGIFIDTDGDYFNCWGVTDNHSSDTPICLSLGEDFMEQMIEGKN